MPDFLRTDGFRYRAGSAVVGAALDTLRVAVVVVNDSRQPRLIWMSSICAPFNRIGVTVSSSARKWDSDIWQPAKRLPTRDSAGNPILLRVREACWGLLREQRGPSCSRSRSAKYWGTRCRTDATESQLGFLSMVTSCVGWNLATSNFRYRNRTGPRALDTQPHTHWARGALGSKTLCEAPLLI
jgi:hypothetical protein